MSANVSSTKASTSKKAKKVTKPKVAKKITVSHPPTSVMVDNAIKSLKERGGSSLQAIKKYIISAYKVDAEKVAPFIKKYLKKAADEGKLTRTKGKGASGSFKLHSAKKATNVAPKKPRSVVKVKTPKAPKKVKSVVKPKTKAPIKKSNEPKKTVKKASPKKIKATKMKKNQKIIVKS